jgi:hypothetical protein
MFLEVDFGQPEVIDGARLECAARQYDARTRLEGRVDSDEWKLLDAQPEVISVNSHQELGRAAAHAILARGVRWLMINDTDAGAQDLRKKAAAWGIAEIAQRGAARLYRLD